MSIICAGRYTNDSKRALVVECFVRLATVAHPLHCCSPEYVSILFVFHCYKKSLEQLVRGFSASDDESTITF